MVQSYEGHQKLITKLSDQTFFISQTNTFGIIEANFRALKETEKQFKNELQNLLGKDLLGDYVSKASRENFENYLSKELTYFVSPHYNNTGLSILFKAISDFKQLAEDSVFLVRKDLLQYQKSLVYTPVYT